MRTIIVSTTVAAAILTGMTGCNDQKKGGTKQERSVQLMQHVRSLSESKKGFESNIQTLSRYGLESNRTVESDQNSHYLLKVTDPQKAMLALMRLTNQYPGSFDPVAQKAIEGALSEFAFGVDVDWAKYQHHKPKSVMVYFIDEDAKPPLKKLVDEKKLSAYLSYDDHDTLKQIIFNDLDEKLQENNESITIKTENTHIDFTTAPSVGSTQIAYTFTSDKVKIDYHDNERNSTITTGYRNVICDINKKNAYLGTQTCKIPEITFALTNSLPAQLHLYDIAYSTSNTLHDKKIKSHVTFDVASAKGDMTDTHQAKNRFDMKALSLDVLTDNIDEQTMKSLFDKIQNAQTNAAKDMNSTINELTRFIGDIYSKGTTIDYSASLDSATGDFASYALFLKGYTDKGKGSFDENLSYRELSKIDTITVTDKASKADIFAMHHMQFGYAVKDLYNFIPSFFDFSAKLATINPDKVNTYTEQWGKELGEKIVHHGMGFDIDPISFDDMKLDTKGKQISSGALSIALHAMLKPNDVPLDINNPMTGMMLMPYLQTDGKIVIKKKDLEALAKHLPPQMVAMAMMLGKPQGDDMIYELKFQNGHLLVNGQPMM